MRIFYINFLIIALLCSCMPDDFTLKTGKYNNDIINGYNKSVYGTYDDINDNTVMLKENGYVSLRRQGFTELTTDITVELIEGEGVQFAIRCVKNKSENHPAILFTYSTSGSAVQERGKASLAFPQYKAKIKEPVRIVFKNDCKRYDILLDCDTVYTGWTDIPNTDYLLVKSLPKSRVFLTGISMVEKNENENDKTMR